MSALDLERIRERRIQRARRSPSFRYPVDGEPSPAEDAAARLAQYERDQETVAAALAEQDDYEARQAELRAEAGPRLVKAERTYSAVRSQAELALFGGTLNFSPAEPTTLEEAKEIIASMSSVDVVGLLAALEELARLRSAYESCWDVAFDLGLPVPERIMPLSIGNELMRVLNRAASA